MRGLRLLGILTLLNTGYCIATTANTGWHFIQNGTSGISALEAIVVSPTLVLFFDRAIDDPLTINGHSAWGALWNLEKNIATALDVVSDTFCASGGYLSNGTMVSVGGNLPFGGLETPATDGRMGIRIFEPCQDTNGIGCTLFEDLENVHLAETRWYPSSLRIFDGSLMIIGGSHEAVAFYNIDPVNSFEFFPPKDGGVVRPSAFLERSLPANLFPRGFALPDGRVFIAANNRSAIYDVERNLEITLPDIPNGVRVTNPFDGAATLLPLSPPLYIPEVLVCGGAGTDDSIQPQNLSSQDPASDQCSRITLTPEGIKKGWQVERLLESRMMAEMLLLPNGQVLIISGAQTGYAAFGSVKDLIGNSNADHPAFTPSLYTPSAPLGRRISNVGMPTTDIARVYHSIVTLTPNGNILLAGSNPNPQVVNDTEFHTEFRVEYLNPPFMSVERPKLSRVPSKISYNHAFTVDVSIPRGLNPSSIKVALMDLGYSSHAFHSSSRLVFMDAKLSANRKELTILSPPNNRVYPPGPAHIFLTVDDVTSSGEPVMVGNGASPPVRDQGIRI